ncbi:hypothetical protein MCOR27_003356 [Pyricularia oryzae]|uniref:DUF1279 domain-containing protein n=2 Tax=Pyricularia TaxID=48558 RepID=A0ABQ8N8P7_PYRGI|nr:hypothetical protein MCOR01_007298 [Pyricularia oryzae]KAI6293053.1 hypothetical protein MCOR33_009417 [Pyricularia grisea]KAH9434109.1 hypothetical protein MCOR02_006133 [Pyricularia oryzae]KAI6261634.1 hypothetical protein MCOR19_002083 [Pyricularia oryzae]KAI6267973.1 hypothetical protein MCOR26_009419 [Pyricularia oryzae]
MYRRTLGAFQALSLGRSDAQPALLTIRSSLRHAWKRTDNGVSTQGLRHLWASTSKSSSGPLQRLGSNLVASRALPRPRFPTGNMRSAAPRRTFHSSKSRRSNKEKPGTSPKETEIPDESLSLSQRMRQLSRVYGRATIFVYFALSIADFPFCFLLVRFVGTDRISEIERWVVSNLSQFVPASVKDLWHQWKSLMTRGEEAKEGVEGGPKREISSDDKWGVKEAQENHKEEASLATQLALAYAVHKSFIFIRVPLTAAVTPRVVKTLRSWGWDIGKKVSKA